MLTDQVFWIMEYARRDKLGRLHTWKSAGIATSEQQVEAKKQELVGQFDCEVRAHQYSHMFGSRA